MPEPNIIIIAGGGGMKEGAIPWLKRVVLERCYSLNDAVEKNIQVFSIEEFLLWANRTLR